MTTQGTPEMILAAVLICNIERITRLYYKMLVRAWFSKWYLKRVRDQNPSPKGNVKEFIIELLFEIYWSLEVVMVGKTRRVKWF